VAPRQVTDWAFFAGQGKRVEGEFSDRLRHHVLDLSSVKAASDSAAEFLSREKRLDIIIAAAAAMDLPQSQLSPDGWERTWAIAHLGHVTLINELLRMPCLLKLFPCIA
jgi:NAD(P)-dependent dehydrogenase (short-subunit alcohol dehydrogenase family)